MSEHQRPLKVFLCHASQDKPKVRELYRTLRRRGMQPWLDAEDLIPGQNWEVEIPKALYSSDAIIICLSPNSVDKEGYVQKEIKFALDRALEMPEGRIFLIPARLEECDLPFSLSKFQAVNLFEKDGYTKLMKALKLRASQLKLATVELPNAGEVADEIEKIVEGKKEVAPHATKTGSLDAGYDASDNVINVGKQETQLSTKPKEENVVEAPTPVVEKLQPKKTKTLRKPNTAIIVALIGLVGTIFAAMLSSPWIEKWFLPIPAATETEAVNATLTFTIQPVTPSKTGEPSRTPREEFTPTATPLPTEITDAKGISMVLVPAGEFTMGFPADIANSFCQTIQNNIVWYGPPCRKENYLREEPVHSVSLNSFFMDIYEVSNEEYEKCILDHVCMQPSSNSANRYSKYYDNEELRTYPVLNVTWDMAKTYCEWRGSRLPTEAEWEKAARGTGERTHPWGTFNPAYELYRPIFYEGKANMNLESFNKPTMPVSSNPAGLSPYGLYNMAGNVAEWVADWYGETYYGQSPYENPLGPSTGDFRVVRGGSVNTYEIRTTARDYKRPTEFDSGTGIRCAKDAIP